MSAINGHSPPSADGLVWKIARLPGIGLAIEGRRPDTGDRLFVVAVLESPAGRRKSTTELICDLLNGEVAAPES